MQRGRPGQRPVLLRNTIAAATAAAGGDQNNGTRIGMSWYSITVARNVETHAHKVTFFALQHLCHSLDLAKLYASIDKPTYCAETAIMNATRQITIGNQHVPNPVVLAPMSGVTDAPFRRFAERLGAG